MNPDTFLQSIDISCILAIAKEAGEKIMAVYNGKEYFVESKDDSSPLTMADKASHVFIKDSLEKFYSGIPILSEEGGYVPYEERKKWRHFWLVDPLDGTKEFIKRNGEFTVNIALMHDNKPVLGVIYAPAKGEAFYAIKGSGAYKIDGDGTRGRLSTTTAPNGSVTIVASRSHKTPELENYVEGLKKRYGNIDYVSSGSSLKFCLVAEGKAHIYPRLGPTMEWDTAAGQVIVEEANGKVRATGSESSLKYNKENLLNPNFIASYGE